MSDAVPNVPEGSGVVERLRGKAKEVVGSVTGDDALRTEGRLHQERADAEEEARREAIAAEQSKAEADLISHEQELAAEHDRLVAENAEADQRRRLERARSEKESDLEQQAEARRAAVDRAGQVQKAAAAANEADAADVHQRAERDALLAEEEAERARRKAASLDLGDQRLGTKEN